MHLNWRPRKVFYGWWIVGACFFIGLYTGGVVFYGFTAIFEPLVSEFGWSYAQISLAASLRGLEAGLLAPFVGMLVDRWGPRRLLFGGVIIASLGLMLLSRTTSLGMFYGAFGLLAIGMSTCGLAVLMPAVANWFRRKISLATGIMVCGYAFGGLMVPVMVSLIDKYEWRMALGILAMGMLVICLPLSLLVRHKPEQYGHLPDGEVNDSVRQDERLVLAEADEVSTKARQALKSSTFWHIALAVLCWMVIVGTVVAHVMPYLGSIGVSRAKSSLVASAIPLASIGGRLGLGSLGDRIDKRRIMAAAFAMMSVGLLCFGFASSQAIWLVVPFLAFFGIGYGAIYPLVASAIREFFGRGNFGVINGATIGIIALGNIAGPPIAGYVFDNWGSYRPIWFVFVVLAVVALFAVATTPPFRTSIRPVERT